MESNHSFDTITQRGIKRLGLLGGTFDPVHSGHIAMCLAAAREFSLDAVGLLVAGDPPHKDSGIADKYDRLAMARLACAGRPQLLALDMEVERQGVTFTIDTLREFESGLPGIQLFYIIGEDTLAVLDTWKDFEKVVSMVDFIYFSRPSSDASEKLERFERMSAGSSRKIYHASERGLFISSTEIRERCTQELSISGLVPEGVEGYIKEHALYRHNAMDFEGAKAKLKESIPKKRYEHTLGVIETSKRLARLYGADMAKAEWAALLHDCAKGFQGDALYERCEAYGVYVNEYMKEARQLVHAPLGARIAEKEYGMHDKEVLGAIESHTTGKLRMTDVEKIIYLADMIEPGREFEGLEILRKAASADLDKAVRLAMEYSIQYVLGRGELLHPYTVLARNELMMQMTQRKGKQE